jgi:hypothetical protein
MRGLRLAGQAAVTAAVLGCTIALGAGPAFAANTFVQVTPDTAQAGTRVNIQASCEGANDRQAQVQSDAFGRVILMPERDRILASPSGQGLLVGSVVIPGNKKPGTYAVNLECANGNTASTTLTVVNMTQPTQGPAAGGGGTAGRGIGPLVLAGGLTTIAIGVGLGMLRSRRRGEISG